MMSEAKTQNAQIILSVIVAIVSDTTDVRIDISHLGGCLEALTQQINPPSMEIIVPYKPPIEGIEELKQRYPFVAFIPIEKLKMLTGHGGSREHHDELRARGLVAARGEIVALLEDHARPDPHWCDNIIRAHCEQFTGYAAVGGAIENGIDRPLNWSVYFCDFGKYQNPVPTGKSLFISDANASYKRSKLELIRPSWQASFHETIVNWTLVSRGDMLALSPEIVVYQHRSNLEFNSALKERFIWGRSYASNRRQHSGIVKSILLALLSPLLPFVLLSRMTWKVIKKSNRTKFLTAFPITAALTISWALGEFAGYLNASPTNPPELCN